MGVLDVLLVEDDYVTKPTGFDLFIDAIRKAGNFYLALALARLPH